MHLHFPFHEPFVFRYYLVTKQFTSISSFQVCARPVRHALKCPCFTSRKSMALRAGQCPRCQPGRAGIGHSATRLLVESPEGAGEGPAVSPPLLKHLIDSCPGFSRALQALSSLKHCECSSSHGNCCPVQGLNFTPEVPHGQARGMDSRPRPPTWALGCLPTKSKP